MKKIAFFSIPAYGHTNPMLPVAAELVKRENIVRFYSFDEFEAKIKATGADFVSCSAFLPDLSERQKAALKKVSTTEMTIQDIRLTLLLDGFLADEFKTFQPDVVFADSVCFWGKLNAWKHNVPLVVSTSTFAFNKMSSRYMKHSLGELADMIFGLPKIAKALKSLELYGYHVKKPLALVQNDNKTDTVVYTSRAFQPCAESFSEHYAFVGPSVSAIICPNKQKSKPLVYVSLGTVINDRPAFYKNCVAAFKTLQDDPIDVIISCGHSFDIATLGSLPQNIQVYPYVDQLDILAKADCFITHCGMNSVSESLFMATPMVLYPQTSEQHAVAKRTQEVGAGTMLTDDSASGILTAVTKVLNEASFASAAKKCSEDFRQCSGAKGAAEFIEGAAR